MTEVEKVKQPTMMPTRKVALGAANGAGALVGVNVLLIWWVGHLYGDGQVPKEMFDVLIWVNGIVTVLWQTLAGWFVHEVRPRLAYAIEHALDEVLPLPKQALTEAGDALREQADAMGDAARSMRKAGDTLKREGES